MQHLQILAAAELVVRVAQQHDGVAARFETAANHLVGVLDQPNDAQNRRRINRPAVGFVVQADVATGDRNLERNARGRDPFDRPRRTAT